MTTRLPSTLPLLTALPAMAADVEESAAFAPPVAVDMLYVVLFILILVGGIVAVIMYLLWADAGTPPGRK